MFSVYWIILIETNEISVVHCISNTMPNYEIHRYKHICMHCMITYKITASCTQMHLGVDFVTQKSKILLYNFIPVILIGEEWYIIR